MSFAIASLSRILRASTALVALLGAAWAQSDDPVHGFTYALSPSDEKPANPQPDPPRMNPPSKGDPVDLFTGMLVSSETDLRVAGRGMDVNIERTYASNYAGKTSMGHRHNFNWFQRIVVEYEWVPWPEEYDGPDEGYPYPYPPFTQPGPGENHPAQFPRVVGAYYYEGGHRIEAFKISSLPVGSLRWTSPAGFFGKLEDIGSTPPFVSASSFQLRMADGRVFTFAVPDEYTPYNIGICRTYWLTKIEDRTGNKIQLLYGTTGSGSHVYHRVTTIVDTLGRRFDVAYESTTGWIQSVTDFTGRTVAYEHDTDGNLTGAISPPVAGFAAGRHRIYGYGATPANHDLITVVDPREVANSTMTPYLTNEYDSSHRVVKQLFGDGVHAGGWYRFIYQPQGTGLTSGKTLTIDPNGNVSLVSFLPSGADPTSWQFTGRCRPDLISSSAIISDVVTLDPLGPNASSDSVRTDAPGYEPKLRASDPPCFITTRTYNSDGLLTRIDAPGSHVEYVYDSGAPDVFQHGNRLIATRYPVPDNGEEPIQEVFAYEPYFNQLRARVDPRGNSATYQPQNGGTADPDRYRSSWVFDFEEGNLATVIAMAQHWGIDTAQTSMFGVLGTRIGSLGAVQGLSTDLNGDTLTNQAHGNVIVERKPTVQVVGPDVLSSGFLPQTIETRLRYNPFGQVNAVVDPEQALRSMSYESEADPDGDGAATPPPPTGQTLDTTTGADGGGYLKETALPEGIKLQQVVDQLGRVTEAINGRGFSTKSQYDALDQLVLSTDAQSRTTAFTYDGNGNMTERTTMSRGPEIDGTTRLPTGNEVAYPDIVDHYTYDVLDQLVTEDRQADPADHASHERLVTKYRYDKVGNCVLTILPEAVANKDTSNVAASIFDERDLVYTTGAGGWPPLFDSLFANGNIAEIGGPLSTSADLSVTTTNYYPSGIVHTVIDGEGKSHASEYDAFLRLKRAVDPLGNYVENTIDPCGSITDVRFHDASNVLLAHSTSKYDEIGRVFETGDEILPVGSVVEGSLSSDGYLNRRTRFDRRGAALQEANDAAEVVAYTYDGLGRNTGRVDTVGNALALVYDDNGNVITKTETERVDATQQLLTFVTHNFYDELDRLTATTDSLLQTIRQLYDSRGNVVFASDARSAAAGVSLASLDVFQEHTGLSGLTTNDHGNTTRCEFDDASRPTATYRDFRVGGVGQAAIDTSAALDGQVTVSSAYDLDGRLIAQGDDAGNVTTYQYDSLNRLSLTGFADGTAETRLYDGRSLPVRVAHANRYVETLVYDDNGRLSDKTVVKTAGVLYGTTFEHYEYDGLGRMTLAQDDDSSIARQYDAVHGVQSEQIGSSGATVTVRDGLGSIRTVTYPGGQTVNLAYDAIHRLDTVTTGSSVIADYSYVGWRVASRFNSSITQKMAVTYDSARRPTEVKHTGAGGAGLGKWKSTWDAANNKTSRTHAFANVDQVRHDYSYDSLDRMTASQRTVYFNSSLDVLNTYDLDGVNNRLAVSGQPYTMSATTPEPADLSMNQYTTTPFDTRAYDKNGNLTVAGSAAMKYDYRNQMVEHASGGVTTTYRYDCFGRRIGKSIGTATTNYFYAGPAVVEERDGGGVVQATYVYGASADDALRMDRWNGSGWDVGYLLADDLSNVVKVVDSSTAVLEAYEYEDYGAPLVASTLTPLGASVLGNTRLFSGREYDAENGFYYFRARYLDPLAGRFTTRDPIGIFGDAANNGNGSDYVGSNPWSYRDPSGLKKRGWICIRKKKVDDPADVIANAKRLIGEFTKLLQRLASAAAARGDASVSQGLSNLGSAIGTASSFLNPPMNIDVCGGGGDLRMDPTATFYQSVQVIEEKLGRKLTDEELRWVADGCFGKDVDKPPHTPTFAELVKQTGNETPAQRDARIQDALKRANEPPPSPRPTAWDGKGDPPGANMEITLLEAILKLIDLGSAPDNAGWTGSGEKGGEGSRRIINEHMQGIRAYTLEVDTKESNGFRDAGNRQHDILNVQVRSRCAPNMTRGFIRK